MVFEFDEWIYSSPTVGKVQICREDNLCKGDGGDLSRYILHAGLSKLILKRYQAEALLWAASH